MNYQADADDPQELNRISGRIGTGGRHVTGMAVETHSLSNDRFGVANSILCQLAAIHKEQSSADIGRIFRSEKECRCSSIVRGPESPERYHAVF